MKKSSKLPGLPNRGNGLKAAPAPVQPPARDPRELVRADWIALTLLIVALFAAPIWAGTFSTPPSTHVSFEEPLLDTLGLSMVVAFVGIALALVAGRELQRPVRVGAVRALWPATALFVIWAGISLSRSQALYLSINAWSALVAAVVLGGLVSRLGRDPKALVVLIATLVAAGSLVGALAVNEYLAQWMQGVPEHRVFGPFVNPDFLAGYMLLMIPITLSVFVTLTDRVFRLGLGVALVVQTAAVLLSGSRAGTGVLAVEVTAWLAIAAVSRSFAGKGRLTAAALGLMIAAGALASSPTMSRLVAPTPEGGQDLQHAVEAAAHMQNHSAEFRKYTWEGTTAMAKANPAFGTGLGTFEVAYPRYAETAYTEHAHNSYLQLAAEIGVPGLLLLLTVLAAACAFGAYVIVLPAPAEPAVEKPSGAWDAFDRPRLLVVGMLVSILGSLAHSFMDSDWYIVATAVTLAAVVGVMVAQARDIAVLAVTRPSPLPRFVLAPALLIAALMFGRAASEGLSQTEIQMARTKTRQGLVESQQEHRPENALLDSAVDAYYLAMNSDPLDPESRLALAQLFIVQGRYADADPLLHDAVKLANVGRTWYRLGQFYAISKQPAQAVEALEHAHTLEPNNIQTLHALGNALADAGQPEKAQEVLREATALEHAPYGTVRAVPELIETEFAYIHAKLGDLAFDSGDWQEAATEYRAALTVLREYWKTRHLLVMQSISPEKREALAQTYDEVLGKLEVALQKTGKAGAAEANDVVQEQLKLKQDRQDDAAAIQKELNGNTEQESQ